jgi:hypothetical protein
MRLAEWYDSSEVSIISELVKLKEIETNLEALLTLMNGDFSERSKVAEALSFVQQAGSALSRSYGVERRDKRQVPLRVGRNGLRNSSAGVSFVRLTLDLFGRIRFAATVPVGRPTGIAVICWEHFRGVLAYLFFRAR